MKLLKRGQDTVRQRELCSRDDDRQGSRKGKQLRGSLALGHHITRAAYANHKSCLIRTVLEFCVAFNVRIASQHKLFTVISSRSNSICLHLLQVSTVNSPCLLGKTGGLWARPASQYTNQAARPPSLAPRMQHRAELPLSLEQPPIMPVVLCSKAPKRFINQAAR